MRNHFYDAMPPQLFQQGRDFFGFFAPGALFAFNPFSLSDAKKTALPPDVGERL
jgi:hypothetical protein